MKETYRLHFHFAYFYSIYRQRNFFFSKYRNKLQEFTKFILIVLISKNSYKFSLDINRNI